MPKRKTQYQLIEFDKRQAEWVVVAYYANDAQMIQVIEDKMDPHTATGSLISGCPAGLVMKENKAVGLESDPKTIAELRRKIPGLQDKGYFLPRSMSIRQAGKKSNHGLNYDMGYLRFALENEMDNTDARRCVDLYHEAYPNIRNNFHLRVRNQLKEDRTLVSCYGRRRRFLDVWGTELFDAAYSFIPQSTVVDMLDIGLVDIFADARLKRFEPLAQVHDSILLQYPDPQLDWGRYARCCQLVKNYITPTIEYNAREFRIETDVKVGLKWGSENMVEVKLTFKDLDKDAELLKEAQEKLHAKEEVG